MSGQGAGGLGATPSPIAQQVPVTPQSGFGIGPSPAPQPTAQSAASSAQVAPVGSAAQSQQQATQAAQTPAPLPAALAPTAAAAPAAAPLPARPGATGTASQWDQFYAAHDVGGKNTAGSMQPSGAINTEFQNPQYLNAANPHYNQYMGYNEAFKLPTDISQWESNFGAYGISGNEYKDLFNKLDPYNMYGTKTQTFANNPLMGAFQQSYAPDISAGLTAEKSAEATQLKAYNAYQQAQQQYQQQQAAYQQQVAAQEAAYQQQLAAQQAAQQAAYNAQFAGPLSPLGFGATAAPVAQGSGALSPSGLMLPPAPSAAPVTAAQARYNAAMKAPAQAYSPGQFSEGGPYGGMGRMIGFTPTPQLATPSVGAMTGTNPTAGGFGNNGPFNNTVGTGVMYGPPTVPYGSALGGFGGGTPAGGNDISISGSDAAFGGPPAGTEDVSGSAPVTPVAQGPLGDIGPPGNPNQSTFGTMMPDAPVNQNITEGTPAQNLAFDQSFSFLGDIPPSQDFPTGETPATPADLGTYKWAAGGPKAGKLISGLGVNPTIAQIAAYAGHPISASNQSLASLFGINLGTPINLAGNIEAQARAALGSHYDPSQWGNFPGVPLGDIQAAAKGAQSIFDPSYGIGDIINNPGAVSGQQTPTQGGQIGVSNGGQIGPVLPQAINSLMGLYNYMNPTAPLAPPTNPAADFPLQAAQSGVGPQSGNIVPTPGLPGTGGPTSGGAGLPPIPSSQAGIIEQLASDYGPVFQAINNNPAIAQPIMQMMEKELGSGATAAQYQSIAEMMANQMLGLGTPLTPQGVTSYLNSGIWGKPLSSLAPFGSFGGPTQENLVAGLLGLETPTGTSVPTGNFSVSSKAGPSFTQPGVIGQPNPGLGGGIVTQIIPTPSGKEYLGQDLGLGGPLNAWRNSVLGL